MCYLHHYDIICNLFILGSLRNRVKTFFISMKEGVCSAVGGLVVEVI